jgi:hypothetical protein
MPLKPFSCYGGREALASLVLVIDSSGFLIVMVSGLLAYGGSGRGPVSHEGGVRHGSGGL